MHPIPHGPERTRQDSGLQRIGQRAPREGRAAWKPTHRYLRGGGRTTPPAKTVNGVTVLPPPASTQGRGSPSPLGLAVGGVGSSSPFRHIRRGGQAVGV